MVARPALEQQVDHSFVPAARRPPDHFALVQISNAVHVCAGVEQDSDALEIPVRRSKMERARVVTVTHVRVGTVLDQQLNCVWMTHGQVQTGAACGDSLASEIRIVLQKRA